VASAGVAIAHYPSFNTALEAKRSLNIPDSTLARFLGSEFEGAMLAEPPLRGLYKEVWRNEANILKIKRPLYERGSLYKTRGIIEKLREFKSLNIQEHHAGPFPDSDSDRSGGSQ
jgi:hypothetical protein